MNAAAVLFGLAAMGGITMLVIRLRGAPQPPMWLAVVHGLIAVAGLIALGTAYAQAPLPALARWALLAFIVAAVGGGTLFFGFHLRGKALPIPFVLGHGLIALAGLGLLVAAIYQ